MRWELGIGSINILNNLRLFEYLQELWRIFCYFKISGSLTSFITMFSAPLHLYWVYSHPLPSIQHYFLLHLRENFWGTLPLAKDSPFWMPDGAVTWLVKTIPTKTPQVGMKIAVKQQIGMCVGFCPPHGRCASALFPKQIFKDSGGGGTGDPLWAEKSATSRIPPANKHLVIC